MTDEGWRFGATPRSSDGDRTGVESRMHAQSVPDVDVALLVLVSRGRSTRQIAEERRTTISRARRDICELRRGLSASTNIQAVVIAIRRGII